MQPKRSVLRVAVPTPLRTSFDYVPPLGTEPGALIPGQRLRVPFGRQRPVGVLLGVGDTSRINEKRLKPALGLLDADALLPPDILALLEWASSYYHYPIGEVIANALPVLLRRGAPAAVRGPRRWQLSAAGARADPTQMRRAPRQAALLTLLKAHPEGLTAARLEALQPNWRDAMRRLVDRGLATELEADCLATGSVRQPQSPPQLNDDQNNAIKRVCATLGRYQPFLLQGVTGSGKTEVYLGIIGAVVQRGLQALVLVPEISLTPQTVRRFEARFGVPVAVMHSGLNDQERLCAWLMARDGRAPIVIGTRSAVFTPMRKLGVIVIDEEHDLSFKQQEGFRYHARDIAVMRARRGDLPIVLGSATPSLESLHNAARDRYHHLSLPERVGGARPPRIHVLDVRSQPMKEGLSESLLRVVRRHLDAGGQILLFLNRRGYAPILICHDCGWVASCTRCDARMTLHQRRRRLRCHHCGQERSIDSSCPGCGSRDLLPVGQGTERVEEALRGLFPDMPIARIDRDTTRRKGAMGALLADVRSGQTRLLVGTQMLAKGHHFPGVTLVGLLDIDQGLFGADFRAGERMAQLILQVAGRAGRADRPGEVYVQTHHPDHLLLQTLLAEGYEAFAQQALAERREACLPPYTALALLRAEAVQRDPPHEFLEAARTAGEELLIQNVSLIGPVPAPMERRAGRYRAQLLVQADQRGPLHRFVEAWLPRIETHKIARQVRWSLDVDPMETL